MFDDGDSQEEKQTSMKPQDQSETDKNGNGSNFHFPMLAGATSSKNNLDNGNNFNQMSPYLGGISSA